MIKKLFELFSKLDACKAQSKMPATNIAIIFQLSILRPRQQVQPAVESREFIVSLIEDFDILFQNVGNKKKKEQERIIIK